MDKITLYISAALAVLILASVLGWRVWRVISPGSCRLDDSRLFFLLVFLAILALRVPQIMTPLESFPDESQLVVQGARYLSHPVPWRDVDGTTSGPLNSFFLSLPMALGAPADCVTARVMLWVANCLTLVFLYLALRSFGSPVEAQLALLPAILFYAFVSDGDSILYTSETLPVLLLSVCIFLLAREWVAGSSSSPRLFCLGLLAGAMPFVKLQVAPLAFFMVAIGLVRLVARPREARPFGRTRKAALLCLGATLAPGLILGVVFATGAFGDFWKSYILAAHAYMQLRPGESRLGSAIGFLMADTNFQLLFRFALAALALLLALSLGKKKLDRRLGRPLAVVLAYFLATIFCVLAPGKNGSFTHYLTLFIPALAIFLGLVYFAGKALLERAGAAGPEYSLALKRWALAFALLAAGFARCQALDYFHGLTVIAKAQPSANVSWASWFILKASRPGDTMSVWGWMPRYYIETGLIPATRDAIGHYVISPGPYQDYFRHRYLKDLEQSRPPFFVDAVVKGAFIWTWSEAENHESFPELKKYIAENYRLWRQIQLTKDARPLRLYVRNERFAELKLGSVLPPDVGQASVGP